MNFEVVLQWITIDVFSGTIEEHETALVEFHHPKVKDEVGEIGGNCVILEVEAAGPETERGDLREEGHTLGAFVGEEVTGGKRIVEKHRACAWKLIEVRFDVFEHMCAVVGGPDSRVG